MARTEARRCVRPCRYGHARHAGGFVK